jgi:hypothetical protein
MDGHLRTDLCEWMEREEEAADLVLAMGSSLCGMNADRMVETAGSKRLRDHLGLGAVIVGFQRTRLDGAASLRIFAAIDEVMLLLAREMDLPIEPTLYSMPTRAHSHAHNHRFAVPYDCDGKPSTRKQTLFLGCGAKLKLTAGPGKGFVGEVVQTPAGKGYTYSVRFPCTREGSPSFGKGANVYALGAWMVEEARQGQLHILPVVNV